MMAWARVTMGCVLEERTMVSFLILLPHTDVGSVLRSIASLLPPILLK